MKKFYLIAGSVWLLSYSVQLYGQISNQSPIFQLLVWEEADQAGLITLLGEDTRTIIQQ